MKKIYILILSLALAGFILNSCEKAEESETTAPEKVLAVKATVIKPTGIEITNSYTGSVEGAKQAVIYSKIAEAVDKVNISEGAVVSSNQVLIELDKTGPSSSLIQAQSLFANAEKYYKKKEYLLKEGAISESEFDAAKTDYEVQKANFEAASKLVNIESPISGTVTALDVAVGDFVQIGQKLATVAVTSDLRIKFDVNAADVKNFALGHQVFVDPDNGHNRIKGKVVAVAASADPQTRSFQIEVAVDNNESQLKPGMFVRVIQVESALNDVIVISRKSILILDNKETVFVVNNGMAERRIVELGQESAGMVVIKSGLKLNDTLVVVGHDYLGDSTKVNITELVEGTK